MQSIITRNQLACYNCKYYEDFCSIFDVPENCSMRCTQEFMDRVEKWFNHANLYISLIVGVPLSDIKFQPYQEGKNNKENELLMKHAYLMGYSALLRVAASIQEKIPTKYFTEIFIIPEEAKEEYEEEEEDEEEEEYEEEYENEDA